jgi:hypothetical protein
MVLLVVVGVVSHERHVDVFARLCEYQQPGMAGQSQQRLRPCASQRGSGSNKTALLFFHRLADQDATHQPLDLYRVPPLWQWTRSARFRS